jgi:rhodanese-related sulfurtransferase
MKQLIRVAVTLGAAALVGVPAAAWACGEHDGHASLTSEPRSLTVADVAKLKEQGKMVPVDANERATRSQEGVIPGAVLLTSASQYALSELPSKKDTTLVFYCANAKCTASKSAAVRAIDAGYSDVAVLPVGIKGWKAAGQPTARAANNS